MGYISSFGFAVNRLKPSGNPERVGNVPRKKPSKKDVKKALDLFELGTPLRDQIVEFMFEENIERDRRRSQSYIV